MLDDQSFRQLLGDHPHAVSIYLLADPKQVDARGPEAGLRTALGEAEAALRRRGLDDAGIQDLLAPAREAAAEYDPARHRGHGLMMFAAPGVFHSLPLPEALPSAVVVGGHFHVKPLLPVMAHTKHFFILGVSRDRARLLAATPFEATEVPLQLVHVPQGLAPEGATEEPVQSGPDVPLVEQGDHFRAVAHAVLEAIGNDTAPIILAAEPETAGHFPRVARLPTLQAEVLHVNPFALTDADLLARVVEMMRPVLDAEVETVLEQVQARLGTGEPTVAIRLEEIVAGAWFGRVDAVVVASDDALWGTFDPDTNTVHAHGHPVGADEDLLNVAAVKALQTGGRAYALPLERLPRRSPAVATMRY